MPKLWKQFFWWTQKFAVKCLAMNWTFLVQERRDLRELNLYLNSILVTRGKRALSTNLTSILIKCRRNTIQTVQLKWQNNPLTRVLGVFKRVQPAYLFIEWEKLIDMTSEVGASQELYLPHQKYCHRVFDVV